MAALGVVRAGTPEIVQEVGAGLLPVAFTWRGRKCTRVTMTQRPARFFPTGLARSELARSLGLSPQDFDPVLPPKFVSTGVKHLMVPVRSDRAVARLEVDYNRLRRLLARHAGVLAYVFHARRRRAHARGFAPEELIEDPATGSAAGPLGAYLVKHGVVKPGRTLQVAQGIEMGRPSRIEVEVEHTAKDELVPRVSGTAVIVARGEIWV
jgi:PhzF family phenazine biosynthesis protein